MRISSNKQADVELSEMPDEAFQINPFSDIQISEETETVVDENDSSSSPKVTIKNSDEVNKLILYALQHNMKIIDRIENGYVEVPGFQISQMPSLAGEIDVGRAIKHLPGVMPGTELTNGMYVRGGSQDQNLVLIDGIPIYNTNHVFGFILYLIQMPLIVLTYQRVVFQPSMAVDFRQLPMW